MHLPAAVQILLEHAISLLLGKRLYKMHLMSHLKILPAHFHFLFFPSSNSFSVCGVFQWLRFSAASCQPGGSFRTAQLYFCRDFIHALSGHPPGTAGFWSHLHERESKASSAEHVEWLQIRAQVVFDLGPWSLNIVTRYWVGLLEQMIFIES